MVKHKIPEDVTMLIFRFLHGLRMREILSERRLGWKMYSLNFSNDRGYSIRNYYEDWNTTPRYFDRFRHGIYGTYMRDGGRYIDPL